MAGTLESIECQSKRAKMKRADDERNEMENGWLSSLTPMNQSADGSG